MRAAILERDGRRCAICGGDGGLHIHHINQDPTDDAPANLITLCGICHTPGCILTSARRGVPGGWRG